jgi:NAD(P)-dependent dehydrogenase (short-subunit alcohol dehydrogenase family)
MLSGSGPYYAPLRELDFDEVRRDIDRHLLLPIQVGLLAAGRMRPGGSLVFIGGTGGRRRGVGLTLIGVLTAALPALVANLALELAPVRVNLVAPGFVDTSLSDSLLGDDRDERREQLRVSLPIGRVVGPEDVAALAGKRQSARSPSRPLDRRTRRGCRQHGADRSRSSAARRHRATGGTRMSSLSRRLRM